MLKTKFRDLIYSILIMIHAILFSAVSLLSDAGAYPEEVTGERLWIDHAATLVERAATGRAEGKRFTNDVRARRADLRELMQRSGTDIPEARRQLHMSMVLLGVLLKTASGCQSGGHVVCPPGLLSQLGIVLKNTYINLDAYEGQRMAAEPQGTTQ
jgi:hypothetical protein